MRQALEHARILLPKEIDIVGAEIGVIRGENSLEILSQWKEVTELNLIDNYICGLSEKEDADNRLKDYANRIKWHIGDSKILFSDFRDESLDFIYIDGDHTYDGVMADMANWWPKIKVKGVMCGHDYNPSWESTMEVVKAVQHFSLYTSYNLNATNLGSNSDWWMIKY